MSSYASLTQALARGWNTWNTRSFLSHVLLPEGFAVNLAVKDYWKPAYLKETLMETWGQRRMALTEPQLIGMPPVTGCVKSVSAIHQNGIRLSGCPHHSTTPYRLWFDELAIGMRGFLDSLLDETVEEFSSRP